jgi:hypothetical protein
LEYHEAKSKLIDGLYGNGRVSLYLSNKTRGNYILLLRIPHRQPDNAGSWIIPLKGVPEDVVKNHSKRPLTITEAIKLFEEYHGE